MLRKYGVFIGLSLALLLLIVPSTQGTDIQVEVTEPAREGMPVGAGMAVKGKAQMPGGHYLWVLVHREDFEEVWWPQGSGNVDPETGDWKVQANFGQPADIGWDFEIAVIVVQEPAHLVLKDYRKKAMMTGDWRPLEMPKTACAPVIKRVKKVSH